MGPSDTRTASAPARLRGVLRARGLDAVIVAAGAAAQVEVWTASGVETPAALIPFALVWGFGLLARTRFPGVAQVVVMLAVALQALLVHADTAGMGSVVVVGVLIAWTIGTELEGWRLLGCAALLVALVTVVNLADPDDAGAGDYVFPTALFGVVLTAGLLAAQRARTADALMERAQLLEQQRHERQVAALAEERTRIARELHDVVAHGLSVIAVQAGAAQEMLDRDPGSTRAALAAVETTARDSLVQMRAMLGVLRADGDAAGRAPLPGLEELPELVAQVRLAGLPVTLRVDTGDAPPPPAVALTAYRVVQEALTNALRHAGPARARVAVVREGTALAVEVCDDGRGPGDGSNGGHGLIGMRERAAVHGGTVETGPAPGGGFLVRARIPVPGWEG